MTKSPQEILKRSKSIAIVGLSDKPERPSNEVARHLIAAGYKLYPVNPNLELVLGMKCYPSLRDIPDPVDIVDVFRKAEDCLPIAEEAAKIGASALWLQLGIQNDECRKFAEANGMDYVEDHCTKLEHQKLVS